MLIRLAVKPFAWRIPLKSRCISVQSTTKKRPDYFPYGVSNFEVIRREGSFFKDTTRHLEIIEQSGKSLSLFRPARWGKSLFARTMESYYCALNNKTTNPAQFQLLFGDTHVGKNTTPEQGEYVVLFWDFSIDTTGDTLDMRKLLYDAINGSIKACQEKYCDLLKKSVDIDQDNAMNSFRDFARFVKRSGYPLYLIIDEYDRFANKLLFETPDAYAKMISGTSGDPKSSLIRSVLETVKSVSGEVDMKTFITGISPMTMADSSGYNVCENITHLESVASIVGFEESDIMRGLSEIFPSDTNAVQSHLKVMKEWYNGYRMHPGGPLLYNPTLCLHYMKNLARGLSNTQFKVLDVNVSISKNIFELVAKNRASNELVTGLSVGEDFSVEMQDTFRLLDLLTGIHDISRDYLLSFMFHHGIVTYSKLGKMVVPNELSRTQFLGQIHNRLGKSVIGNIRRFLETADDITLKSIVHAVTRNLHSSSGDVHNYNESSMRNAINAAFRTGCSRKIESEKIILGSNLRPDILIYDRDNVGIEFVFELGTVRIGSLDLKHLAKCTSLSQEMKTSVASLQPLSSDWTVEEKQRVEDAVGQLSEAELLELKFRPYKKYDSSKKFIPPKPKTIENFVNEKARQVWKYANDCGLVNEHDRANLQCRAIVGVGMQRVVIRSVDAAKPKP